MAKPNPALVSYIEKHLSKGVEIKRIKQKLSEVGHPIAAIEDAASFVTQQKPALKTRPKKFMIVYGIILILLLSAAGWYAWFKSSQQAEYTQVVEQIETTKSYQGMDDIALLKLAASGDTAACKFIKDHNIYYACTGKAWLQDACGYSILVGDDADDCYFKSATKLNKTDLCYPISAVAKRYDCLYQVEEGVDYKTHLDNQNKSRIAARTESEKSILDFSEAVSKDFSLCYSSSPDTTCLFLSMNNGQKEKLLEYYGKKDPDRSWEYLLALHSLFKTAKSGGNCGTFSYSPELKKDVLPDVLVFRDLCSAMSSKNKAACSALKGDMHQAICSFLTLGDVKDCGENPSCSFYFRLYGLVE